MKMTKIILGGLSFAFSLVILFQSCAAGMLENMTRAGDFGGVVGMVVAFVAMLGGIILITTRNGTDGTLITSGMYIVAAVLAQCNKAVYRDLAVWGFALSCFAVVLAVFGIVDRARAGGHKDIPIVLTVFALLSVLFVYR